MPQKKMNSMTLDEKIRYYSENHAAFCVPVGEPGNDGNGLNSFLAALRSLAENDEPTADIFGD